jgi:hypothetical protein
VRIIQCAATTDKYEGGCVKKPGILFLSRLMILSVFVLCVPSLWAQSAGTGALAGTGYVGMSAINQAVYNHNKNTALLASPSAPVNGVTNDSPFNTGARALFGIPAEWFTGNRIQRCGEIRQPAGDGEKTVFAGPELPGRLHLEQKSFQCLSCGRLGKQQQGR